MTEEECMATRLPLSTLLSQALIAYTIEFDNEYEQRAPHTTTVSRLAKIRGGGPWLVSQPMWTLFLRHIGAKGTPVHEIQALACLSERGIKSRLHHLEWWQYIKFAPDPSETRAKPRYRDLLVHLTPGGKRARDEWKPLNSLIDRRWRSRFGKDLVGPLQTSLRTIADGMEYDLPDYLPIVDYPDGMRATLTFPEEPPKRIPIEKLDLSALLSRVLLALTIEFEETSDVSLTIAANVLRVVEEGGTSFKEMPARGAVAKEGVSAAVNFLKKNKFVVQGTDKAKMLRLTPKGKKARSAAGRTLANIEKGWAKSFGAKTVSTLRESLEGLAGPGKSGRSRLADAIEPPEQGWRWDKRYRDFTEAFLADPRAALPHHPMVLHRGGFPDGS
jgi:DNA-binding MarR family transcriptional regulator